jgi:DNA polymerase-3 subunit delta'
MPWLQPAWALFRERIEADRLAHALLLHGPRGTGKSQLARAMLETLLCLEPGAAGACGHCRSCALLVSGAHPEAFPITFLVDPKTGKVKKELLIEQIRALIASLGLTTTISRRKVALIDPADAMNRNAVNALLKTLEEPPGDAVLILLAHEPSRLPATIRSRCQAIGVSLPATDVALGWLTDVHGLDAREARDALVAAGGSPLLALDYHQQDLIGRFVQLDGALDVLFQGQDRVSSVLDLLGETEPDTVWSWLSGMCSARVRAAGPRDGATGALLRLQGDADRNRRLARTAVRGDLLLRDWLIEWCRAGARARG